MIYTLGCSFTKWHWPTWADWLAGYQGPVVNWAYPGYNNQLIYWLLMERLDRLSTNDHVYIMWTENNRIPQWYDSEWINRNDCRGFFPNNGGKLWFGQDKDMGLFRTHPDHQFSQTHNVIETFKIILDTQHLLEKCDVKYTMLFMRNPWVDVRPEYGDKFITNWDKKIEFNSVDCALAEKILRMEPVSNLLKMINWDKFAENVNISNPESYTGLWEYFLSKKELVLLKHASDNHPNTLAHHDYLTEKILKQNFKVDNLRAIAKTLANDSVNMSIPAWTTENFIGSPDKELFNTQEQTWVIKKA
jgi:hypothetical protein